MLKFSIYYLLLTQLILFGCSPETEENIVIEKKEQDEDPAVLSNNENFVHVDSFHENHPQILEIGKPVDVSIQPKVDSDVEIGTKLYMMYCSGCHGALNVSDKRNVSINGIKMAISQVPEMKTDQLKQLTDEQLSYITLALSFNADSSSFMNLNLGTRHYVSSKLKYLFSEPNNENATLLSEIDTYVFNNVETFGGPSHFFHDDHPTGVNWGVSEKSTITPNSSLLRAGKMVQICNLIHQHGAVQVALQKINLNTSSQINKVNVNKLINLYFSLHEEAFTDNLIQDLINLDNWDLISNILCISPLFELL